MHCALHKLEILERTLAQTTEITRRFIDTIFFLALLGDTAFLGIQPLNFLCRITHRSVQGKPRFRKPDVDVDYSCFGTPCNALVKRRRRCELIYMSSSGSFSVRNQCSLSFYLGLAPSFLAASPLD